MNHENLALEIALLRQLEGHMLAFSHSQLEQKHKHLEEGRMEDIAISKVDLVATRREEVRFEL